MSDVCRVVEAVCRADRSLYDGKDGLKRACCAIQDVIRMVEWRVPTIACYFHITSSTSRRYDVKRSVEYVPRIVHMDGIKLSKCFSMDYAVRRISRLYKLSRHYERYDYTYARYTIKHMRYDGCEDYTREMEHIIGDERRAWSERLVEAVNLVMYKSESVYMSMISKNVFVDVMRWNDVYGVLCMVCYKMDWKCRDLLCMMMMVREDVVPAVASLANTMRRMADMIRKVMDEEIRKTMKMVIKAMMRTYESGMWRDVVMDALRGIVAVKEFQSSLCDIRDMVRRNMERLERYIVHKACDEDVAMSLVIARDKELMSAMYECVYKECDVVYEMYCGNAMNEMLTMDDGGGEEWTSMRNDVLRRIDGMEETMEKDMLRKVTRTLDMVVARDYTVRTCEENDVHDRLLVQLHMVDYI